MGADQNDTTIQPSSIMAQAYLTQNEQHKFVATSNLMFGQNKYESYNQFLLINFPLVYLCRHKLCAGFKKYWICPII